MASKVTKGCSSKKTSKTQSKEICNSQSDENISCLCAVCSQVIIDGKEDARFCKVSCQSWLHRLWFRALSGSGVRRYNCHLNYPN